MLIVKTLINKMKYIILFLLVLSIYSFCDYLSKNKLVCIESTTVKWIGVCNKHAHCVVGFENGRIDKSVPRPYIGEEICTKKEWISK